MNLKKCTVLFLAFLLLVSNAGFAFDVHYCGGEVASVSLNTTASATPQKKCCETKEEKSSCCKDKVVHFEKKSDNATFKVFFFQLIAPAVIQEYDPVVFLSIPNFKSNQITTYYSDANAPPLFKLYNQYIFYS
ncbi:HYC_CC_PP family protein [Flavobacterium sp. FlaQc-28]|uniref:HYC_CC_PP family protein n=1 Tax=Flavobacterium sp. FlaQc-28 TaxID=3374178 RepID=UPI003757EA47